jgi:hypothetical protein
MNNARQCEECDQEYYKVHSICLKALRNTTKYLSTKIIPWIKVESGTLRIEARVPITTSKRCVDVHEQAILNAV